MSTNTRSAFMLLTGLLLLTISIAILNTLVPLWLTHAQQPTWRVGMVSSSFFAGNLIGTLLVGPLIKRLGLMRCYYLSCLIFAIATACMMLSMNFWSWMGWRFVAGVGYAWIWVVTQSAILYCGNQTNRGVMLAAYMIVYYLATVIGQLLLTVLPTGIMQVLPWATAIVILAMLPMVFASINAEQGNDAEGKTAIWSMIQLRSARLGVYGCLVSGVILGTLYAMMPLFLAQKGMSDVHVGYWMALLVGAGIIGQWPVDRLASKLGRLLTLRMQVVLLLIGCAGMLNDHTMLISMFVLGFASFTLYPVAMVWSCDKVAPHQLVAMNQTLYLSFIVGCLAGPSVSSVLMHFYSNEMLFAVFALVGIAYLLISINVTEESVIASKNNP